MTCASPCAAQLQETQLYTDLGSHKSGFVGKTKDYAGRDAQVGCRANARPPLSRYL